MNHVSPALLAGIFLALTALIVPTSIAAEDEGATPIAADERGGDLGAADLLDKAKAFYAGQNAFSVRGTMDYGIRHEGGNKTLTTHLDFSFRRPNELSLHVVNSQVDITFISDGKRFLTYVPVFDQYTVEVLSGGVASIVESAGFGPLASATKLLAEFVQPTPFDKARAAVPAVATQGEESPGGPEGRRLHLDADGLTWDMWVDPSGPPVVRRIVPDMADMIARFKEEGTEVEIEVTLELSDWQFGEAAVANLKSKAPEGAMQVADFSPPSEQPPVYQLLGKPAPDFSLDLMDGTRFDLAAKKGKEIIILDFWATWCGPCRVGMPILSRVSKALADDGVRLYAVNLRESPADIKNYLKSQGLDIAVALDSRGRAGDLYKVDGIPQTVIIGKDGTIQVIHVGVGRDFETVLSSQLMTLISGVNLADVG